MKKLLLWMVLPLVCAACMETNDEDPEPVIDPVWTSAIGTLTVTPLAGGDASQFSDIEFRLEQVNETEMMLHMIETRFVAQMPALDMDVPQIAYTVDGGDVLLSGDAIVPLCKGVPYVQYMITALDGRLSGGRMELSFNCFGFHVDYDGTVVDGLN